MEKGRAQDKPYNPQARPSTQVDVPAYAPSLRAPTGSSKSASGDGGSGTTSSTTTSTTESTSSTSASTYYVSRSSAVPAGIPWQEGEFNVLAQDQDLRDLLRQFATAYGVRVSVSDKIDVKVSGKFEGLRPEAFLEQMCRAYNLMTFYDGNMLYIYRNDESTSKIIQMKKVPPSRLLNVLRLLGLTHPAYAIRVVEDEGILMVSGPPKFLETVEDLANKMDVTAQSAPADSTLRIFYLKNAWANDMTFDFREEKVTVPGVVTSLQNLMAGGTAAAGSSGPKVVSTRSGTVPNLMGKGLVNVQPQGAAGTKQVPPTQLNRARATTETVATNTSGGGTSAAPRADGTLPSIGDGAGASGSVQTQEVTAVIQGDVRLNAVIVRDSKDKMEQYETLIAALDQPVEVIEITAAIVDVQSNYTYQLGINWSLQTTGTNGGIGVGTAPGTLTPIGANGGATQLGPTSGPLPGSNLPSFANLIPGSGLNFSTVLIDSGLQFLSNVKALETQGRARTLSRPSVLTLDNMEALIEREETAYVKVNGFQAVDLFNVSTGVKLKVTPHIIDDHGRRKIKLVVDIKDGSFTPSSTPDGVPNVQESKINTQSVIMERQSLLVGGIFREEDNKNESGVPFIRKVPLLGALFKEDNRKKTKLERMFLITPRIVRLSQSDTRIPNVFDNSPLPEAGEGHPPVTSSDPARRITDIYPPDGMRGVEGRSRSTYQLRNISKPQPDYVQPPDRSQYRVEPEPIPTRTIPAHPTDPLYIPPFGKNGGGGPDGMSAPAVQTAQSAPTTTQSVQSAQATQGGSSSKSGMQQQPTPPRVAQPTQTVKSQPAAVRIVSAPTTQTPAPNQPPRTPVTAPAPTPRVTRAPRVETAPSAPAPAPVPRTTVAVVPSSASAPTRRPMGDGGYAEEIPTAPVAAAPTTPAIPTAQPADSGNAARSRSGAGTQRSKH